MIATTPRRRPRAASRSMRALAVVTCMLWPPRLAWADPAIDPTSAQEPAGYSEAIEAALNEHQRGNFEEARAHFQHAHELYPNARTLRGLGKVEFELRNYGEAVRYLQGALDAQIKPLDAALRAETERLLERAQVYVGEVHVDVDPGSATVAVDGVTVASGPRVSLSLVVGDHILEFRALGRVSERRSVRVRGGEETVIQVVLPTQGTQPALDTQPVRPAEPNEKALLRKQWWLWTSVGVVAASALAVGLVVGLRDREHEVEDAPMSLNTPPGLQLTALGKR